MKIYYTLSIILFLFYSCQNEQSIKKEIKKEDAIEKDSLELITRLDREKIRIYNTSISTIANAMKEKIFGTEQKKMTIENVLEIEIAFRNNKGDSVRIPLREVIDTIYYE